MAKKKKEKKTKDPAAGDGAPAKSGPGVVSQLIIAVALGAASFGTVYMLPSQKAGTPVEHGDQAHAKDPMEGVFPSQDEISFIKLDDLTLTLSNLERILKIGITLETVDDGMTYIDPSDPVLRDAFTGYLRALRMEQIEDAAFMAQLRNQLLRRAKLVFGNDVVHGILITDFLVR